MMGCDGSASSRDIPHTHHVIPSHLCHSERSEESLVVNSEGHDWVCYPEGIDRRESNNLSERNASLAETIGSQLSRY